MIGNKYFKLTMVNGSVITYNVLNTAESCSEWYPDKQQPSTAHHTTSLLVSSCSLRNEMARTLYCIQYPWWPCIQYPWWHCIQYPWWHGHNYYSLMSCPVTLQTPDARIKAAAAPGWWEHSHLGCGVSVSSLTRAHQEGGAEVNPHYQSKRVVFTTHLS